MASLYAGVGTDLWKLVSLCVRLLAHETHTYSTEGVPRTRRVYTKGVSGMRLLDSRSTIDFWDFSVQDLKSLLPFIYVLAYLYCRVSYKEGLHYIQVKLNPTL
ncbi:hypothetical protein BJ166DRAFT_246030 [Pestalotiopsis sp. NC0098]|nr:hypothetical protein BJ166DRAFT_246030 [Pestalotiopsis sp. NC0098]